MTILLAALLLQSSLLLPPRTAMENPSSVSPVPAKIVKDYDRLWARFVSGKEDAKLVKDLDNFSKKQKNFDSPLLIQAYIGLYVGDDTVARQRLTQVLGINPKNRIALYYLAEIAFVHQDYAEAATLYAQLAGMDSGRPDLETRRQRAVLLATDEMLRSVARAESENRLADAEKSYRQVLTILPQESSLHQRLADLLARENKKDEADAERKIVADLMPRANNAAVESSGGPSNVDTLDDLGRWGSDIDRFHQIRNTESISREQLALILVRYFPQLTELRQTPQIVTDIQDSPARAEIQTSVGVGLLDTLPNHTFDPSLVITRGDLALALWRLMRLLSVSEGTAPAPAASDLDPTFALYPEITRVLSSGVMTLEDSGRFNVSGEVSGAEAVRSADRLTRVFQQAAH
jgi:tetratricopeptide (TPR) repeat protein